MVKLKRIKLHQSFRFHSRLVIRVMTFSNFLKNDKVEEKASRAASLTERQVETERNQRVYSTDQYQVDPESRKEQQN